MLPLALSTLALNWSFLFGSWNKAFCAIDILLSAYFTLPLSDCLAISSVKESTKTTPKAAWLFSKALLISLFSFCNSLLNTSNDISSATALAIDSFLPRIGAPEVILPSASILTSCNTDPTKSASLKAVAILGNLLTMSPPAVFPNLFVDVFSLSIVLPCQSLVKFGVNIKSP